MSLIEYLGGLLFKLLGMNAERRKEVAIYMASIAETLGKFGPRWRDGAPSDELRGYAAETEDLTKRFADATSDVLPKSERDAHIQKLEIAFNAKFLLAKGNDSEFEEKLAFLAEVAGTFRSAAATLRASANKFG